MLIYKKVSLEQEFAKIPNAVSSCAVLMADCLSSMTKMMFRHLVVTSMLVLDVGDEMCWVQLKDVGDGFGHVSHQHPLSFHTNLASDTNIEILSPTSKKRQRI